MMKISQKYGGGNILIIKCTGIILVAMSICIFGFYYSYIESYREKDLNELKKALTILLTEINYTFQPLEIAFRNISSKVNSPIKNIFLDTSNILEENKKTNFFDAWKVSVEKNICQTYFNKDDEMSILDLGKTLGYLDTNLQITNINMMIDYIDYSIVQLNKTKNQNKKLYQCLSFLVVTLIIILIF